MMAEKSSPPAINTNFRINEGDWICDDPECANVNFARRLSCNICGKEKVGSDDGSTTSNAEKKKLLGHEIGKAAAEKSRGLFSADDWQCGRCGNVNWARRQTCNMCNAPKFGENEKRTGLGGGYNDREEVEYVDRHESDSEYDDFGRKKKKFRSKTSVHEDDEEENIPTSSKTIENINHKGKENYGKKSLEEEEDEDDEDDDGDLSKYDLSEWTNDNTKSKNLVVSKPPSSQTSVKSNDFKRKRSKSRSQSRERHSRRTRSRSRSKRTKSRSRSRSKSRSGSRCISKSKSKNYEKSRGKSYSSSRSHSRSRSGSRSPRRNHQIRKKERYRR